MHVDWNLKKLGQPSFDAMTAKIIKGKYYGKYSLIPFILLDIFFATRKEHFFVWVKALSHAFSKELTWNRNILVT